MFQNNSTYLVARAGIRPREINADEARNASDEKKVRTPFQKFHAPSYSVPSTAVAYTRFLPVIDLLDV